MAIRHTFNILNSVVCVNNSQYYMKNNKLLNDKGTVMISQLDTFTFGKDAKSIYCFVINEDYLYVYDIAFNLVIKRDLPLKLFTNIVFAKSLLYMQVSNIIFIYDYLHNILVKRVELCIGEQLCFEYQKNIITKTHNRIYYYTRDMLLVRHIDSIGYINAIGIDINGMLTYRNDNDIIVVPF